MNAIRIRTRIESETLTLPELKPLIGRAVEIIVLDEQPVRAPLETHETMFGLLPPKPDTPDQRAAELAELRKMAKNDTNLAKFLDLHEAGVRIDVDAIIASRNADQT
jgi:hypothetical protein